MESIFSKDSIPLSLQKSLAEVPEKFRQSILEILRKAWLRNNSVQKTQ